MKFEWHAKSVAFWSFPGLILGGLILSFGLSLLTVQAESLYQKTPRLSQRTRMEVPQASPMLDLAPDSSADSRIHDTPPPSVYSDLVPVSWQPERNRENNNKNNDFAPTPASTSAPQLKPPHPVKPAVRSSQSYRHREASDWQPVVLTPSTGPTTNPVSIHWSANPEQGTTISHSKSVAQSPVVVSKRNKADSQKIAAVQNGRVSHENPVALQTSAEPVAHKASAVHKSNEKPLVHFPQELSDTRAAKNAMEPGFYPVGYRPYLPASAVIVSGQYQEALSHYNRGSYYGHANQLSKAIQEYQQAIRKNPDLADAYVGLSSAYLLKTQWEEVFINAKKALSLKAGFMDKSNITQAKFNLSTAYCAADDYGNAKFFYNSVKLANHAQTRELWEYLKKNCKP